MCVVVLSLVVGRSSLLVFSLVSFCDILLVVMPSTKAEIASCVKSKLSVCKCQSELLNLHTERLELTHGVFFFFNLKRDVVSLNCVSWCLFPSFFGGGAAVRLLFEGGRLAPPVWSGAASSPSFFGEVLLGGAACQPLSLRCFAGDADCFVFGGAAYSSFFWEVWSCFSIFFQSVSLSSTHVGDAVSFSLGWCWGRPGD